MKSDKPGRGLSFGSIMAILLTVLVVGGSFAVLHHLRGNQDVVIDPARIAGSLALTELKQQEFTGLQPSAPAEKTKTAAAGHETMPDAVTEQPAPAASATASLTFGGSVHLQTDLRRACYYSQSKKYDFSELLALIAPKLNSDLALVSLESILMSDGKLSDYVCVEDAADMLSSAGVDGVLLAYPRVYDQAMKGLASTVSALSARGLTVTGSKTEERAPSYLIRSAGGIRIGVVHQTASLSSNGKKLQKKEDAGWAVNVAEESGLAAAIASVRQEGADFVICSFNWGENKKTKPVKAQLSLAQAAADAGADLIVGTGTETIQPLEWLKASDGRRVLCAYSLGSLMTSGRTNTAVASILLQLTIQKDQSGRAALTEAAVTPVYIWRFLQDGQYHYRAVPANQLPPDGMDDTQIKAMTRALERAQEAIGNSGLAVR